MRKQSSSTLIEDLANPPGHPNRRAICRVISEADKLPPDHGEAVRLAVDNPKWSARQLSTALRLNGITVSFSAITNHRRGVCPCYRKAESSE